MCRRHRSYRRNRCRCRRCQSRRVHGHCQETNIKQCSKRTYSESLDETFKQYDSERFDRDDRNYETYTKPAYERPSYDPRPACGCARCRPQQRRKGYTCHCHETIN